MSWSYSTLLRFMRYYSFNYEAAELFSCSSTSRWIGSWVRPSRFSAALIRAALSFFGCSSLQYGSFQLFRCICFLKHLSKARRSTLYSFWSSNANPRFTLLVVYFRPSENLTRFYPLLYSPSQYSSYNLNQYIIIEIRIKQTCQSLKNKI